LGADVCPSGGVGWVVWLTTLRICMREL